jgi:hypothetical protein
MGLHRHSGSGRKAQLHSPDTTPGGAKHLIDFTNYDGSYSGAGRGQRMWRILPTLTGWRLEFRDPGDRAATYAGTFGTLHAAKREAAR